MRFVAVYDLIPETEATPAQIGFATASHKLTAAGRTLATMAAHSREPLDPTVARALAIHVAAVEEWEAAYAALMGYADPVPAGLAERCITAINAEKETR